MLPFETREQVCVMYLPERAVQQHSLLSQGGLSKDDIDFLGTVHPAATSVEDLDDATPRKRQKLESGLHAFINVVRQLRPSGEGGRKAALQSVAQQGVQMAPPVQVVPAVDLDAGPRKNVLVSILTSYLTVDTAMVAITKKMLR